MSDSTNFNAALEAFEEHVRDNIKLLSAKDPKSRMKAAAWLGEAGDPTAITMLMQVYKADSDPKVRAAAQYSLGMFRKLEEALKQPDQSKVQKLLEDVAVNGKMGRRLPFPVRSLVKFEIALVISAVLVAVLAFVVPSFFHGSASPTTDPNTQSVPTGAPVVPTVPVVENKDRATVLGELQSTLTLVTNNATKLQTQYQSVLGGGALDCKQFFDSLIPVVLSADNARDFADLATIANDINSLQASFRIAKATYDQGCEPGAKVDATTIGAPMGEVVKMVQSVATIQAALTTASAVKPA